MGKWKLNKQGCVFQEKWAPPGAPTRECYSLPVWAAFLRTQDSRAHLLNCSLGHILAVLYVLSAPVQNKKKVSKKKKAFVMLGEVFSREVSFSKTDMISKWFRLLGDCSSHSPRITQSIRWAEHETRSMICMRLMTAVSLICRHCFTSVFSAWAKGGTHLVRTPNGTSN